MTVSSQPIAQFLSNFKAAEFSLPPEKFVANYQKLLKTLGKDGLLINQFSLSLLSDIISYLLSIHQPILAYIAVKLTEGHVAQGTDDPDFCATRQYEKRGENLGYVTQDHKMDTDAVKIEIKDQRVIIEDPQEF